MRAGLLFVALALAHGGCASPEERTFRFKIGLNEVTWEEENALDADVRVIFSGDPESLSSEELLEFYHEGERVDVVGRVVRVSEDLHTVHVHTEVLYSPPDAEEYVMVHRPSSWPADYEARIPLSGGAVVVEERGDGIPWGTFEGNLALVTRIVRAGTGPDGGRGDAGP